MNIGPRFTLVAIAVALAGCQTHVRVQPGSFFTLTDRHVAFRDLTRPIDVDNDSLSHSYQEFPAQASVTAPAGFQEPERPVLPVTSSYTASVRQEAPAVSQSLPVANAALWTARAGTTMRAAIEAWAKAAPNGDANGWKLAPWAAMHSVDGITLTKDVAAPDFIEALRQISAQFPNPQQPPVITTFYKRQQVIVVSDRK